MNGPDIYNNGTITITGGSPSGEPPPFGGSGLVGTGTAIQNLGTITKQGDTYYTIGRPVISLNTLTIEAGTLRFEGTEPGGFSVVSDGDSTVTVRTSATLSTTAGLQVTDLADLLTAQGGGVSHLVGRLVLTGYLQMGSADHPEATFDISDTFTFTRGIVGLWSLKGENATVTGGHGMVVAQNNISITKPDTRVTVSFVGDGDLPDHFHVMVSGFGTLNDVCRRNPPGYNARVWTNNTYLLELRRQMSIEDASSTEGSSGTTMQTLTIRLNASSAGTLTVSYATADGTGSNGATIADSDYAGVTGSVTFQPGETMKMVTVYHNGDTKHELDDMFLVNLSNPTDSDPDAEPPLLVDAQASSTILNDDMQPWLSVNSISHSEGNSGTTSYTFTVSLSNPRANAPKPPQLLPGP